MAGLEDQLLGKLILKEKHELEEQRQGLMEEVQSYKKKIKQLEDDLLFRLSNSQASHSTLVWVHQQQNDAQCRMCYTQCAPVDQWSKKIKLHQCLSLCTLTVE